MLMLNTPLVNPLQEHIDPPQYRIIELNIKCYAYTSTVNECDDDPWITATGDSTRPGVIGVSPDMLNDNLIKFGQTVFIPEYGMFTVLDLMARRHYRSMDIWMPDRHRAIRFGQQKLSVFIVLPIRY